MVESASFRLLGAFPPTLIPSCNCYDFMLTRHILMAKCSQVKALLALNCSQLKVGGILPTKQNRTGI